NGPLYVAAGSYSGDELTVYPYLPETITVTGEDYASAAVHIIDDLRVNP
ncbi:TPA: phage tail protein I, partial [Yersinia enterocolitica]